MKILASKMIPICSYNDFIPDLQRDLTRNIYKTDNNIFIPKLYSHNIREGEPKRNQYSKGDY